MFTNEKKKMSIHYSHNQNAAYITITYLQSVRFPQGPGRQLTPSVVPQ